MCRCQLLVSFRDWYLFDVDRDRFLRLLYVSRLTELAKSLSLHTCITPPPSPGNFDHARTPIDSRSPRPLTQEGLLERVQSAFTMFRQHGGKARRYRKRARDKTGEGNEEDAIVAALAKSAGGMTSNGGDGDAGADEDGDYNGAGLPPARRAKFSVNIFEDVDDRLERLSGEALRRIVTIII